LAIRRLIFLITLTGLLLCGCQRGRVPVAETEEEGRRLATVLHVADPRADQQLVAGFHAVEQNSWRWTEERFSVSLRPPRDAAQKGAVLQLKLNVPEVSIARLGAIALEAAIAGTSLGKESYTQPGEFTYARDIPPKLLAGDSVRVDFTLDKHLPPSSGDIRKLGVIVTSVGFDAK
jgi:hypothetical protein